MYSSTNTDWNAVHYHTGTSTDGVCFSSIWKFFVINHRLSVVGCRPPFLMSTGYMVPLREIEPFSATLAQGGLAWYDQLRKTPLEYPVTARNWTRATERINGAINSFSHWSIMTDGLCVIALGFLQTGFAAVHINLKVYTWLYYHQVDVL